MTRAGLTQLALILWLVLGALLVFLVMNAAHFSPWELVIPSSDPFSWVMPGLIFSPPLLLTVGAFMPSNRGRLLAGIVATLLALVLLAILAMMVSSGSSVS